MNQRDLWLEVSRAIDAKILEMAREKKAEQAQRVVAKEQGTAPLAKSPSGSPSEVERPFVDDLDERWDFEHNSPHLEFDYDP